jgi:hypothetical protein
MTVGTVDPGPADVGTKNLGTNNVGPKDAGSSPPLSLAGERERGRRPTVHLRPTIASDLPHVIGESLPFRIRAITMLADDRVIGLGGIAFPPHGPVIAFVQQTAEARKYPGAFHRAGLQAMQMIQGSGLGEVIATTDRDSPRAIRWIERLGFVRAAAQPIPDKWLFEWTRGREDDRPSEQDIGVAFSPAKAESPPPHASLPGERMTTLDIRGSLVGETAVAIKAPCLAATTGSNITLAGVQTIDGVTIGNGSERVLVKDQTNQAQNGIYIAAAGAWTLAPDWQGNTNVVCGTMVMVAGGAVNAGILFVQTCTDNPIVIGVSSIAFVSEASIAGVSQTAASTTTLTIGLGAQALGIPTNKNFAVGQWVLIQETSNAANQMLGQITSYSGTVLVVNVAATGGSGTYSDWTVVLTNSPAAAGYQPPAGSGNVTGPGSAAAGHLATFVDATGKTLADGGVAGALANLPALTAQYLAPSAMTFGATMVNGIIVASVAANALTLSINTLAGNTPNGDDPVWFAFRNATAANGGYSAIAVTTALSLTIPAAATLGFANAAPGRIWLTAVNSGGTVSLAAINCSNAVGGAIFPLAGRGIANVTALSTSATAAQTLYGPATLSAVPYSVLGYASYETGSTLATAGVWSAKPTRLELLRAGVPLPGAVVQSLYNLNTAASTGANSYTPSATVPTAAGGNLVTAQAITPTSSANLLRVRGEAMLGTSGTASAALTAFLTQDSGSNALATVGTTSSFATTAPTKVGLCYQTPAATLIATTFKLWGTAGGGATVNINTAGGGNAFFGGTANSFLLIEEIMA